MRISWFPNLICIVCSLEGHVATCNFGCNMGTNMAAIVSKACWSFLLAFHFLNPSCNIFILCSFLVLISCFLFWYRSLLLSESKLTHLTLCRCSVVCKLLFFDCYYMYCVHYWKVLMPCHSHQVNITFVWQKLCTSVKPPCLFWYLLSMKACIIFCTHSSCGQETLLSHLNIH